MRKRIFSFSLCLLLLLAAFPVSAKSTVYGGELMWAIRLGADYASAPSAVLVEGDFLYTMSGKALYKLNCFTGETVKVSAPAQGTCGYGINPPAYGDGMIFVPLRGGCVQAFDADTLEPLWCTEAVGGQALTPVCYYEGKIFFGTWVTEEREGFYRGYSVGREGCELLWEIGRKGGFYRAGALAEDGRVIFGSDDGAAEDKQSPTAALYTVDAQSGEIISLTEGIEGDIRSSVLSHDGGYVFSTKAGYIYFVKDGEARRVKIGTSCASTPAISGNFAYAGISDKKIAVADLAKMEVEGFIDAPAYPNGGIFIRGNRLYATCNSNEGGVYSAPLDGDALEPLFEPEGDMRDYCVSPVSFGDDAALYYKNDSGHVFALELYAEKEISSAEEIRAWLIRKNEEIILERITLYKGKNILKIPADGGRAFVWTESLEPLTEVTDL